MNVFNVCYLSEVFVTVKSIISILKSILLVIELAVVIAFEHWEKLLFIGIVFIDQFVKGVVTASMVPGQSIPIFKDIFHVTYVLNPGAAFGILPHQRELFLLAGVAILIVAGVFYSQIKKSDMILRVGLIFLLSGAAANLIDRFQNGLVVDFLDFRIWPVFNIADIAIVVGVGFMIYSILFNFKEQEIDKPKSIKPSEIKYE